MSTRRLITVALVCGLAILLAGGVWLVQAGRESEDRLVGSFLPIGATAQVGGVSATLVSIDPTTGALGLTVEMASKGPAVGDPGQGWAVIGARGLVPRAEPVAGVVDGDACSGRDLAPGGRLRCSVTFTPSPEQAAGELVAVFGRGNERASWAIGGTPAG